MSILHIRGERNALIPVGDLIGQGQIVSSVLVQDCRDTCLDFTGVTFSNIQDDKNRALVEMTDCDASTANNLVYKQRYDHWSPQDWLKARNGILIRNGEGNGIEQCELSGIAFAYRVLAHESFVKKIMAIGFSADALRITGNHFEGRYIHAEGAFWGNKKEHCDGIQVHPLLAPEEQYKGVITGLSLKHVVIKNHIQQKNQRWMHGFQVTDGKLLNSKLSNMRITTDNENGLMIAEGHNVTLNDIAVHSPDKDVESQIAIGTRKPNYQPSSNIWTRNVTADRWGII